MTKSFRGGFPPPLRRLAAATIFAVQVCLAFSALADNKSLYSGHSIVTGQGVKNRQIGFRECLKLAVGRVSGDAAAGDDPRLAPFLQDAGRLVESFRYRDLLEGVPIHDEQGTYDRPHDLSCFFQPGVLDPVLNALGRRPWTAARPRLTVFLAVEQGPRRFMLSADGKESPYMVQSLEAAASRMAMPMALPSGSALASIRQGETSSDAIATANNGLPLLGSLIWSDIDLGWVAAWTLRHNDRLFQWEVRGISFDDAFRNGVNGAAKILSGNGPPEDQP